MVSTHDLVVTDDAAVKRYTSWDRGEHEREWLVLNVLHRHAPGLAPAPLSADLSANPPRIVMTAVSGAPLGGRLTDAQLDALETALRRMWSVPVGDLPPRRYQPFEVIALVARNFAARPASGGVVGAATARAVRFLAGYEPTPAADQVLGHGDPNLANYLWDGARIRIVDFEDAGRSDVAYELASLVEHVSARDTDWERFLTRFDVEPADVNKKRCLTAALWLHTFAGPSRRVPPAVIQEQAHRFLGLVG